MLNFVKRILLFQFLFVFCYYRYITFDESVKDFEKRVKYFSRGVPYLEQAVLVGVTIPNRFSMVFDLFLKISIASGFLAIADFKLFQATSSYLTLLIAVLYVNPNTTYLKNKKMNPTGGFMNYIPSVDFLVLISLSFGMLAYSFHFKKPKVEKTPEPKEAEKH